MSPALKQLEKEVLSLPLSERMTLIDAIYQSVDSESLQMSEKWIEEVDSRIEAYEKGEIPTISVEESMEKLWAKLGK